jgi:hypothetical protein
LGLGAGEVCFAVPVLEPLTGEPCAPLLEHAASSRLAAISAVTTTEPWRTLGV